jgi:uncharacterized membrane protein
MSDEFKNDSHQGPRSYSSLITHYSSLLPHHSTLITILNSRLGAYALLGIAAVAALVPAIVWGIPAGHDMPSHLRFAQSLYNAISAGILHPGWGAEANGGFGDPGIRLYPPALYYLLATTRTLSGNWYNSIILGFMALSVLGALGTYFWARCFLPRHLAVIAGILYAFVPYRVNEFYGASLLAEYAAASILPFAFAFVVRVCRWQRPRDIAGLAITFALLVLANLPVAVIASLSLLVYALLNIEKRTLWRSLTSLAIAVAGGLAASAFYWITMLTELPWMKSAAAGSNTNAASYFDYHQNFVFSPFALGNTNSWLSSMLTLATLSMAFAAVVMFCTPFRKKLGWELKSVFALMVLSLFMSTDLSRPVWAVIPKLKEVQFPWRWLVVSSCAVPVLTAASIPFWKEQVSGRFRWAAILALGGVLFSLSYSIARIREANYLPRFEFGAASNSIFAADSLDYWHEPVWMNKRPAPMAEIEAGERAFKINSWGPEKRSFWIGPGPAQDIRIRSFYYPYWVAHGLGETFKTKPAYDGSLMISMPAEEATVQLEFQEPRRTRIAFMASAATWLLLFVGCLFSGVRGQRKVMR